MEVTAMLFSEIYSAYFNTVAVILREAMQGGITEKRIVEIINDKAFSESILTIMPALKNEEWLLLNREGQTPLQKTPKMPLTLLQKRWLKALTADPRIALFAPDISGLDGIEPLFSIDDFVYFDRYADGDPFEDASYINAFRIIMTALWERRKLKISHENRRGKRVTGNFIPHRLEYSSKDDKFRLITAGGWHSRTINLARIKHCELLDAYEESDVIPPARRETSLTFELTDERKALERVMLHFSDCRKETRRLDDAHYHVTLWYDPQDETEMVIRMLAFGPLVRVTTPEKFVQLIKERVEKQFATFFP